MNIKIYTLIAITLAAAGCTKTVAVKEYGKQPAPNTRAPQAAPGPYQRERQILASAITKHLDTMQAGMAQFDKAIVTGKQLNIRDAAQADRWIEDQATSVGVMQRSMIRMKKLKFPPGTEGTRETALKVCAKCDEFLLRVIKEAINMARDRDISSTAKQYQADLRVLMETLRGQADQL